jgi:hypothetical protein
VTILTCTWLSPVRNPATWSSPPPPPLPNPQALQPVVHLGFQRDLPPLPTVSGHCLPDRDNLCVNKSHSLSRSYLNHLVHSCHDRSPS